MKKTLLFVLFTMSALLISCSQTKTSKEKPTSENKEKKFLHINAPLKESNHFSLRNFIEKQKLPKCSKDKHFPRCIKVAEYKDGYVRILEAPITADSIYEEFFHFKGEKHDILLKGIYNFDLGYEGHLAGDIIDNLYAYIVKNQKIQKEISFRKLLKNEPREIKYCGLTSEEETLRYEKSCDKRYDKEKSYSEWSQCKDTEVCNAMFRLPRKGTTLKLFQMFNRHNNMKVGKLIKSFKWNKDHSSFD